jgi:aspartate racemase
MKTIGIIGGMSWESTVTYYQIMNETVKQELGGLHSAKILLYSVDFSEIEQCQAEGDWEKSGEILSAAAESLEKAGADFLVIGTNTSIEVQPALR